MPRRPTRRAAIGLSILSLTGCAGRSVIVETCPPIPDYLTSECVVPERSLQTNGDLARAYLDATECLDEANLKLRSVRSLASCRLGREQLGK
jgi:hypothetical protein